MGLKYLGVGARKLAIAVAKELQQNATDGTEYSVQEYIFSPRSKNRPVKTKIWRNGIDLSEIQKNKKERIEERRKEIAAA
ncbi:hypothetical protein [Leptospira barantonii]|uniref:hypothetical protein n=1 Tax=Leptospira barantonii TaxID=2023184 RepID=UPI003CD0C80D